VRHAGTLPDFKGPHGWDLALSKEVARVDGFKAWRLVSKEHLHRSQRLYGTARVSIACIVVAFRVKTDPDGTLLEVSKCRKARITIADKRTNAAAENQDYYSACVASSTSRLITQLAVEHGALQHTIDVSGAYYKGTRVRPEDGGRIVYARVPSWLHRYGPYPTHNPDGSANYLLVEGNMPGCIDAGRIWEVAYNSHLLNVQGMTQSVFDTRVFYKNTASGWIIAHVHVDDTRLTTLSMLDLNDFYDKWAIDLDEERKPLDVHTLDETFAGVRHHFVDPHTCILTCTASIDQLSALLAEHPLDPCIKFDVPLASDALTKLRPPPCPSNPLLLDYVTPARRIIGLTSFVSAVRQEVVLPFKVLASHVNERRLTVFAWRETRRLAAYLVGTRDMGLTLTRTGGTLTAYTDSSLGNGPDGRSWGGFALQFSGPLGRSGQCQR
jgi:hypothetical protein